MNIKKNSLHDMIIIMETNTMCFEKDIQEM